MARATRAPRTAALEARPVAPTEWTPLWLDHPHAQDVRIAGGKAAPQARLIASGVRVPPGFVVPVAAYDAAMAPLRQQIEAALSRAEGDTEALEASAKAVQELVTAQEVEAALASAIELEALALLQQPLGGSGEPAQVALPALLAVRSSATAEDLPGASFAGQYDTYLGLDSASAVADSVRRCWASYWSARAIAYRREHGVDHWKGSMAVLVQRLVLADAAGVAFTAHPTVGHRYLMMVNAALGLGQGVVDGSVPADEYAVDKDLRQVVQRTVKQKTERIGPSGGGTATETVDAERAARPALTDEQLLSLLDVACGIEREAGLPQDVEWALLGDELYVLQSRPITALPEDPAQQLPETAAWTDLRDRARHWKIATDGYGDEQKARLLKPLSVDMDALFLRSWQNSAYLTGGEKRPATRRIGSYRYFARLDAFPDKETREAVRSEFEARVERYREAGQCMYREEQEAELEATNARLWGFDREGATDAALAEHLEDAGRAFLRHWTLHWYWWGGDWGASTDERKHQGRWGLRYRELTGDTRKDAHLKLLAGLPNRLTAAIDRVMTLARIAQRSAPLREALEQSEPAALLEAIAAGTLPGARQFKRELDVLLAEQGLRSGAGNDADTNPLTPGWGAQPALVMEIVRGYLGKDIGRLRRQRRAADRAREQRAAKARSRVGDDPEKLARFDRAYAAARASAQWFEDHNYLIDSATQSLHYLALTAAARRLVQRSLLDAVDDVMWLHITEVCAALRAEDARPLQPLVAERKAEHARWEAITPPVWLGAPPAPPKPKTPEEQAKYDAEKTERAKREGTDSDRVIGRGQGGSRGVATGRVRIVPTETPVPSLEPGDVLVARFAGPLWTPVFPSLGAIVLQRAQFFQHAMLTAREYGVPAVFDVKDVTKTVQEGQLVTVDGTRGLILRVDAPEDTPRA